MPLYYFKAKDNWGNEHTSKINKEDALQVSEYLKSRNLVVIEIKKLTILSMDIEDIFFTPKVSKKELAVFCRQLSFILESGTPLTTAFNILESQAKNKTFKRVMSSIYEDLLIGESLAASLRKSNCFPVFLLSMTDVAERGNRLPEVYSYVSSYYEKESKFYEGFKSAMIYPLIVSVTMMTVVVASLLYVVPNYAMVFESSGVELPFATAVLIAFSRFTVNNLVQIVVFLLVFILGAVFIFRTEKGKIYIDKLKLNVFIYRKLYVKNLNLKFSHTLDLLLNAGLDLPLSITIIKNVLNNKFLDAKLDVVVSKIKQGEELSNLLKGVGYFEPVLCSMVKIGENTNTLPETMKKCSSYFMNEMDIYISNLNKLIEPLITIVMGVILAFIILAIMLPTFYMTDIF